ncbi:MAG: UvrD-helicase domain-containing protein [Bacteroidales bacterium]|nr:UvrD-helicase domain-containing protein [Candidatus Cryptobacteroides choladohippi]
MENKVSAIFDGLNDEQKKAVACVDGPVLIVAGAGSGKTRVLTSRIANLLAQGVPAERILALTFTKKAASEMKERIAMMVGARNARHLVMGTFHAVFVRFLREYAQFLGYSEQFTIYDQGDSTSAIKVCIKELQLDDKIYKPRDVLSRISMAKNNLVTVNSYRNNQDLQMADLHSKKPRLVDLYELYQKKLKASSVMDFDDILLNMNILLRDNKEALESISGRFSSIMVDEYQDTNFAQYLILKKLSGRHRNICVVGDDSQSIYAFRGAKIENILNFKKDYPESRIFRLERNYRSTSTIVDAANSVIAHNEGRIPKQCYAVGEAGDKIHLFKSYTEQEEAMLIVSDILAKIRTESAKYLDFAILYRTNSQSRALEEQLRRRNVPYMIYSGNSFFERAEVKDLMAYFKLCVNVADDESFKRVVNQPARGIGGTSLSALNECARAHECSLFKAAYMPDHEVFGLKPAATAKIRAFCDMINGLAVSVHNTDAFDIARRIADDSGLYAFYKSDNSIEGLARMANVEELINSVASWEEEQTGEYEDSDAARTDILSLADFLENVSLLSNIDVSEDEDSMNKVALMTVHSSKGLEFPYVYVAGMEENLFPSLNLLSSKQEIEEERRLFYVAITRAKRAVGLSFAETRMRNGKHESNQPSRFIREIDSQYIDNPLDDDGMAFERPAQSWGGFGRGAHSTSFSPQNYGKSSGVTYERRRPAQQGFAQRSGGMGTSRPASTPAGRPASMAPKPAEIDPNFVPVPMKDLYEGERIEHNRFGAGTIKSITGVFPDLKATVVFDDYGEKLLLLKFAKMRPLK